MVEFGRRERKSARSIATPGRVTPFLEGRITGLACLWGLEKLISAMALVTMRITMLSSGGMACVKILIRSVRARTRWFHRWMFSHAWLELTASRRIVARPAGRRILVVDQAG